MRNARSASDLVGGLLPLATGALSWVIGRELQWAVYGAMFGGVMAVLWGLSTGKFSASSRSSGDFSSQDEDRAERTFNPATGLPMTDRYGAFDIGGNAYGSSDCSGWK